MTARVKIKTNILTTRAKCLETKWSLHHEYSSYTPNFYSRKEVCTWNYILSRWYYILGNFRYEIVQIFEDKGLESSVGSEIYFSLSWTVFPANVKLKNSVPTVVIPGFEWYFTNRVPQGYIFSHIFIHYLKIERWSLLMKFADDT